MQILICGKKIIKEAISRSDADTFINEIQNNINDLYYLAFVPQAEALKQRLQQDDLSKNVSVLLRKHFSSLYFVRMMTEEILNELSNILVNNMQGIPEEDMASIQDYIGNNIIPWCANKFLGNDLVMGD